MEEHRPSCNRYAGTTISLSLPDHSVLLFQFIICFLIKFVFSFFLQKDFILAGGPMHVRGGAAIVPNVIKAVEIARSRRIPIIWVPLYCKFTILSCLNCKLTTMLIPLSNVVI